ncbi:putative cation transporter [Sphaerisporangium siamense]|uniref:Cobalt-zinc-cadmium efflux system protein n=1 Tax=Sphaerisporangium siamense TaxID=795645 RepID=A0A7W7GAH9_9ACTN|nr:cation diffusion facilitator family transporter [Sphaerisporangium siamense]MBB4701785.1 cobalt-zinc-cadmium efflux system protein [Sphaerisporangium siamense]GII84309.1 putative cation transporter [Sphaerisporangium siamense]
MADRAARSEPKGRGPKPEHENGQGHGHGQGQGHGQGHGHGHGFGADSDRRYLSGALALIVAFMAVEVVIGFIASSLALISDAGHMLTDAIAIVFALVAMRIAQRPPRGGFTYGLKRAEIVSAQINGITLLLLAAYFVYEGVVRLISPPEVEGAYVVFTGLAGIAVNVGATMLLRKADRSSLNVEGAFQHILNDLYAFMATTVAGIVVWTTGWTRADAVAALVVAALMLKAGWGLVRDSGRVFMEAAPAGMNPAEIGRKAASLEHVVEVHDLHIWEVTSGYAALSAHILVEPGADCHGVRIAAERLVHDQYGIDHTTLQVDHATPELLTIGRADAHCADPHGPTHRNDHASSSPERP